MGPSTTILTSKHQIPRTDEEPQTNPQNAYLGATPAPHARRTLQHARISRILKAMEIHFTPDVEKKLNDLAAESGRGTDDLLLDALAGYFDELVETRDMLNSRYDDLKNGKVKPIDGEEAFARLKAKTAAQRKPA